MTPEFAHAIPPADPAAKIEMLRRNRRHGWRPIPGTLDQEMGWNFDAEDPTAPLWVPRHDGPPMRTQAAPAHWARLYTALALTGGLAGFAGLIVR